MMSVDISDIDEDRRLKNSDAYFNAQFECRPIHMTPGHVLCTGKRSDMLVANVGSGVFVSIYDRDMHAGSAAYGLVSRDLLNVFPFFSAGNAAEIEKCLHPVEDCVESLKARGANKKRLYVRLMGGSNLPGDDNESGTKNYVFIREYINRMGLTVLNEDIGGTYARRIYFFPATGRVVRRILRRQADFDLIEQEQERFQRSQNL